MKKRRAAIIVSEGTAKLFPDPVVDGVVSGVVFVASVVFGLITGIVDVCEGITVGLGAAIVELSAIIGELIDVGFAAFGSNVVEF